MFDETWSEIVDTPGEIYDVIEYKEEWEKDDKFDVESYLNGNTDYWNNTAPFTLSPYDESTRNVDTQTTRTHCW